MRAPPRPASVRLVTRARVVRWLTAVLLAALGGAIVALPVMVAMRNWLNADDGRTDPLVILVGYLVWVLASAFISGVWLRRPAQR